MNKPDYKPSPDFKRLRKVLLLEGEPDRVPLANYIAMLNAAFKYGKYPVFK